MEKTQGFIYLTWLIWTDIDHSSLIGLIRDPVTMNQLVTRMSHIFYCSKITQKFDPILTTIDQEWIV